MKKLGDSYCCSTFSTINQKRMNNLNTPVKNNSSALKVVVQGFETLQDGSSVNIAE